VRGADCGLDAIGVDGQPHRIDVGEDRPRAGHHDRERGVGRGERRGNHFVAGADAERAQDQGNRVRPVADANRVRAPDAAANSRSKASTSGPSTNQPRSMTRSIAARTSDRIVAGHQRQKRDAGLP
jgi:hypothetical protein